MNEWTADPTPTRRRKLIVWGALLALLLTLIWSSRSFAIGPLVLDSMFLDWVGQSCVIDLPGDQQNQTTSDLVLFCFGTNPNEERAYFMAERVIGDNPYTLRLLVDTNLDGAIDRVVQVNYQPQQFESKVDVAVYDGAGNFLEQIATGADWGSSKTEGALLVEWGVTFAQLGIQPGQHISMKLTTSPGQSPTTSDESPEVTWSPATALGWPLLALVTLGGAGWLAHRRQRLG